MCAVEVNRAKQFGAQVEKDVTGSQILSFVLVGVENCLRSACAAGKEGKDPTLSENNCSAECSCVCTPEDPPSVEAANRRCATKYGCCCLA